MADRNVQRKLRQARRRQIQRALWTVLRERLLVVLGAVVVLLLLSGAMGYSYVHAQVYDAECRTVKEVDLTLREMAEINGRAQDYQSDPSRDAHLVLASDEASFMLAQFVDFDERLYLVDGQAIIDAAVPRPSGCVRVAATGELTVTDQVATFTPSKVRLGELDVTGLGLPVGSVSWEPADLETEFPRLAAQLANIDSLEIVDDEVHIRLVDRYKLF